MLYMFVRFVAHLKYLAMTYFVQILIRELYFFKGDETMRL
jgi:hypothetical protein